MTGRFVPIWALVAVLASCKGRTKDAPAGETTSRASASSVPASTSAAAPPPCPTGGVVVSNVPPSVLRAAIETQRPALDACFATLRERRPNAAGTLTTRLRFECGRVTNVTSEPPEGELADRSFVACIGNAYRDVQIARWERVGALLVVRDVQRFE